MVLVAVDAVGQPTAGGESQVTVARRLLGERAIVHDDRTWIAVGIGVGGFVYLSYLMTHQYPAYGGGLYLDIAEQIRANGYGLPARIPGYTDSGVPFAYPPLAFYVAALVLDISGVNGITYATVVPGMVVLGSLVPYYYTAKELLGTPPKAGLATIVFLTAPEALQWHISAGGIVRAPAMLLVVSGAYTGVRLFRDGGRRWLAAATVLFGLTVLTHPTYTVLFGVTFLLMFMAFDRTLLGLGRGIVVALGGVVLAAPWWSQVVLVHGPDVFTSAAGTHSGLAGGVGRVSRVFGFRPTLPMVFYLLVFAGAAYGLRRKRLFLVSWLLVPGYIVGKPRVLFLAGGLLAAVGVVDGLLPVVRRKIGTDWVVPTVVAVTITLGATGALFAGGALNTHGGSATQPAFVDDDDIAAMEWAAASTPRDAGYVVLGDAAEWFPHLTERAILVGPWGVEWTTPSRYYGQLSLYQELSTCHTAQCLTTELDTAGVDPEYVYVPKGHYTVRGFGYHQPESMRRSMVTAEGYERVHENEGVIIFRTRE